MKEKELRFLQKGQGARKSSERRRELKQSRAAARLGIHNHDPFKRRQGARANEEADNEREAGLP